ncbi:AAA-like domain-containing protein [Aerosakkonema funiforme]|uniref:AAA-like domain-containing protein n=3 Tax=Oscillatoriophycideae TaxID=1301283 RepID=A0A926VI47_9CYAN|nr:AAA-like domain-containing protein [Aerosakkonema funiforme]MBD2183059.1 AAA-like domain-containing protein [Aerosakkonema funiforme FACHB-1375]
MLSSALPPNFAGQRILATIVFTDVVNFSARMVLDEEHTLNLIDRDFRLMRQLCREYEGQVMKTLGDGMLMYFASAVQAVTCAVEIQKELQKAACNLHPIDVLNHRIGIHLGDVFFREADVLGNGVNIAARLQNEAEPGGICISQTVYDVVKNYIQMAAIYWGPRKLKGINDAIPLYQIRTTANIRVLLSHCEQEPELSLAMQIYGELKAAGHEIFLAGETLSLLEETGRHSRYNLKQGDCWLLLHLEEELRRSDYLLLLLSEKSATSELIAEKVRRARELRNYRPDNKPAILPIRVGCSVNWMPSYDLYSYLQPFHQQDWRSPDDTPIVLQEVLSFLSEGKPTEIDVFTEQLPPPNWPDLSALENSQLPPVPVAAPELPEGSVALDSAFYVERPPIEDRCYETILQPGALIRIKAPRQMGKTSLMARILNNSAQKGYRVVSLSFQLADNAIFEDLAKFLRWFCLNVGRGLQLPNKLAEYWDEEFGSKISCKDYFENYLLTNLTSPLVLGLDEVDRIFQYPQIADEFFSLLRAWHEEAKFREIWKNFRMVVVHSTEVYIPLNVNQSPFNVGLPIELPEFNRPQVYELVQRHGLNWNFSQVEQLMAMVGGHPYLVRLALYHLARHDMTLSQLLETAATEAGLYGDHLRRHLWILGQHPELAAAMKEMVVKDGPMQLESMQAFKLHGLGLVHLQGNESTPRCNLYRQYFRDRLS